LWNDNGEYRAFENNCPHRGCRILDKDEGCQKLVCPYHKWHFKNGTTIPSQKEFSQYSQKELSLHYYDVQLCGNFVFFSPKPKTTLKEQLGSFWDDVSEISHSINAQVDKNNQPFECNWKIAIENALETYHVPFIHNETLGKLNLQSFLVETTKANDIMIAEIGNHKLEKKLNLLKEFFAPKYFKNAYFSIFLFPFSMISSTYGYSYAIQNFFPKSETKTKFISKVYSVVAEQNNFYQDVSTVNRKVFEEDAEICRLAQLGLESKTNNNLFFYAKNESRIVEFHNHYERAVL
jgi:phenylpropionate dioxygenase-like ring-hydroxylating dioxygenase large terminal subunit